MLGRGLKAGRSRGFYIHGQLVRNSDRAVTWAETADGRGSVSGGDWRAEMAQARIGRAEPGECTTVRRDRHEALPTRVGANANVRSARQKKRVP